MPQSVVVGIDVSKAEFCVAIDPSGERWISATTPLAIDALVERLRAMTPQLIVLEATGGYEAPIVAACAAAGLPVVIVNPRQVRAFAQAIGQNQLAQEQNQLAQEVEIIARRPGTANGIPTSAGIVGTV